MLDPRVVSEDELEGVEELVLLQVFILKPADILQWRIANVATEEGLTLGVGSGGRWNELSLVSSE